LRQLNLDAQTALGEAGASLASVTSALDAAQNLDKAESKFAEWEKTRRPSRVSHRQPMFMGAKPNLQYEQSWAPGKSQFWFDVDKDVCSALFGFCIQN